MDTKHLNYILTIAKYQNMTKAAEQLFVSQSSLSQYLSKLEQELSAELFIRKKGELVLTPAGRLYIDAAKKVIAIQKALYQDIAALHGCGHYSIGVVSNFGLRMLSEILPEFKKRYPGFSIEISELSLPDLKRMIAEDQLDLGITAAASLDEFDNHPILLREEEIFFAIPANHPFHTLYPDVSLTLEDLIKNFQHENFLLSKKNSSLRIISNQLFDSINFKPSAYCETNSALTTRNMICHNAGVGFIAESCSTERTQIAYYPMSPKLFRKNVLVSGKNWGNAEPELFLTKLLTEYFANNHEHPYMAENDYSII